jgi:membrane associated rhomboid family serine protease
MWISRADQETVPIETREQPDVALEEYRRKSRKDAVLEILWSSVFLLFHAGLLAAREISVADLFRSLLFILGVAGFAGGVWGFHRSRRLTVEDLDRHEEAREFARSLKATPLIYTITALSCLAVVACFQLVTGVEGSVEDAGLVKSSVREGEIWRLLTCATLHGGFLHIWMNGQALFGLGRLMESLSDRAYLPLVFLASAACGSVFSQLLLPNTTSVGASGGLMGLVGFLAVLGYRRKDRLPSGFFRSILTSILFMGVIGLVGFALIDNAAHLGGLVGGLGCGHFLIRDAGESTLVGASRFMKGVGLAALVAIALISLLSIVLILK